MTRAWGFKVSSGIATQMLVSDGLFGSYGTTETEVIRQPGKLSAAHGGGAARGSRRNPGLCLRWEGRTGYPEGGLFILVIYPRGQEYTYSIIPSVSL